MILRNNSYSVGERFASQVPRAHLVSRDLQRGGARPLGPQPDGAPRAEGATRHRRVRQGPDQLRGEQRGRHGPPDDCRQQEPRRMSTLLEHLRFTCSHVFIVHWSANASLLCADRRHEHERAFVAVARHLLDRRRV